MLKGDSLVRDLIAEAIRSVIDDLVKEHFDALTQEHQLTSRICGALEAKLRRTYFMDYRVQVVAQEIPDKGPGTLEKRSGVDLYIGIQIDDGDPVSKGFFVQAKWKESGRTAKEQKSLVEQCEKISARTDAGYLWMYGAGGVDVVPAAEVAAHSGTPPEQLASRKINEVLQQVLDCFEGDRRYGLPQGVPMRKALGAMLEEFGAAQGVAIEVKAVDRESLEELEQP